MSAKSLAQRIGVRVRTKRIELGLSQEQLANLSGMHRTYLGAIERGEKNITVALLARIADALEEPLGAMLEE